MPPRGDRVLLGAIVAEKISEFIRTRELVDGDALPSEGALADEHGVSQRVVRDALRLLSQQGVIRTQQGKRAVVSDLRPVAVYGYFKLVAASDMVAIGELIELRQALETKAAGLAAARMNPDTIERLRKILDEIEACGDDRPRRVALDFTLHGEIVRASGNRFFRAIYDALADALTSERARGAAVTESAGGDHEESDAEHRAIVHALSSGDGVFAEKAMSAHLDAVERRFKGGE
jgi:GntR family transcriptional repressor for pyruvate dehydrogenase complex